MFYVYDGMCDGQQNELLFNGDDDMGWAVKGVRLHVPRATHANRMVLPLCTTAGFRVAQNAPKAKCIETNFFRVIIHIVFYVCIAINLPRNDPFHIQEGNL